MFLDQFPDFLHSFSSGEIIVVGDFDFHFENEHDSEACKVKMQGFYACKMTIAMAGKLVTSFRFTEENKKKKKKKKRKRKKERFKYRFYRFYYL